MSNELNITDARMLQLAEILQQKEIIRFRQEMWDAIEIKKQTISNIRLGKQHFTVKQIEMASRIFKVDLNWIFGFSTKIFRKELLVIR